MRLSRILSSAFLSVAIVTLVPASRPAQAGPRFTNAKRALVKSAPKVANLLGVDTSMKVFDVQQPQMTLTVPNRLVWASFGKNDAKGAAKTLSVELGRQLGRRGFMLATGGGNGLPKDTEDGAYAVGAHTIAFTPKGSLQKHSDSHDGNIGQTTHLVLTGTGSGAGTISREAPMAQAADHGVASFANGGPGTFGELTATLHNHETVLVFLKGTGGVADAAPGWMEYLDAKAGFKVIAGSDPHALALQAKKAIQDRPLGFGTKTLKLVSPGKAKPVLEEAELKNRSVAAFLTADPRVSVKDEERTDELRRLWAARSEELTGKPATLVVPSTILDVSRHHQLEQLASRYGARSVMIAPDAAEEVSGKGVRSIGLGFGEAEMGSFASGREITQHADVVFFSSARYNNLASLAYALRDDRKPFIGILANKSTHGDKIADMVKVIEPGSMDRVIVANTPEELVQKTAAKMNERREAEAKAAAAAKTGAKNVDDKKGLD